MQTLAQVPLQVTYQVDRITAEEAIKRHLNHLGIVPGSQVVLLHLASGNGIILLRNSRLALSQTILDQIVVKKVEKSGIWLSLDTLSLGENARVVNIHGQGAIKRRLMDMGLTKDVIVEVSNIAPLGDPIEIRLRGYKLTLRKEEAALVLVERDEQT